MAHLLTISDIKNERQRLINSMQILPMSYRFSEQEKEDLKVIYEDTLKIYDTAIARNVDVKEFELQAVECFDIKFKNQLELIKFSIETVDRILIIGKPNSGKTRLAKEVDSLFNNVVWIDDVQLKNNFTFQNLTDHTDLIVFDDVKNNNSIENIIFSHFSSDTLRIEKRGLAPFNIKTPKLIITADSNRCKVEQLSGSVKRRLLIVNL